jgi:hypothetical protein
MVASIQIKPKIIVKKVNKYCYSIHHKLDGSSVKRRRLNPDFVTNK